MTHILTISLLLLSSMFQAPGPRSQAFQKEMLAAVNEVRAKGCTCGKMKMPPAPPLKWNLQLQAAAEMHANDLKQHNFIAHKGSNGSKISDRVEKSGYKWAAVGENISWGARNISSAMRGWIDSPGHCKSLMNPSFREMGASQAGSFMVQVFGRKRSW